MLAIEASGSTGSGRCPHGTHKPRVDRAACGNDRRFPAYPDLMRIPVQARRAAIRCAYVALRVYWFIVRPQMSGVKCVITHGDEVLLVRHTYGNRAWDLPGGTVRRREVPVDAARREMHEELGRQITDWVGLGELYVCTNHHRDNLHLFHGRLDDRRVDLQLSELAESGWFPRDELPEDTGRYVRPIVGRVRA
jgi:ADP-ribose pyrophosphatase YjhB (NUDIX family)